MLAGCQSLPGDSPPGGEAEDLEVQEPGGAMGPEPVLSPAGTAEGDEDAPPADLWRRIGVGLSWRAADQDAVARERARFLGQRNYLPVVAKRANDYLYHIVNAVEARGLPLELALLPLVESTLNPFATSPSRAVGLWQIMPGTGRHLGLRQDWWYDGRRDLRASTRAALDYLQALHAEFDGDWLLALAAYNSGKGRVSRAMAANARRGLSTDYWSLRLPRETRHYVPRLLALAQIVSDPRRYGVVLPAVPNAPAYQVVGTGGQIEIARAAELAGIEVGALRALNPGQLRWATSPDAPPELLVPVGTRERFQTGLAALPPADRVQWHRYRIRRGDSLIRIARLFATEVDMLREVNGIRGSRIRAGDTMMIPRGTTWSTGLAMAGRSAGSRDYRVCRGDSLYRIAGRFQVSVDEIITWNALDPKAYLQPGQTLTLYVGDG